eukprot:jgi/Botrbrau1/694/Bobra.160_2s0017.1
MSLTLFEPFRDDFFSDAMRSLATASVGALSGEQATYGRGILMDIKETDDLFDVKADIPGVPKDAIKVQVDHNVLSISVQKKDEKQEEKEEQGVRYHRSERSSVFTRRAIRMPDTADLKNIKAKFENGTLHLEVPKVKEEKLKSHTVQIQ